MAMRFFGATMEGVTLLEDRAADPASYIESRDRGRLFYNTTDKAVKFGADGQFKTLDIPAGSVMVFGQSSAPAGWTKKTDWQNNSMMVITNGNISNGGAVDATLDTTAVVETAGGHSHSVSGHTHSIPSEALSISQMPAHGHTARVYWGGGGGARFSGQASISGISATTTYSSDSVGGGGTHDHGGATGSNTSGTGTDGDHSHTTTIEKPYYQTFIVATKD